MNFSNPTTTAAVSGEKSLESLSALRSPEERLRKKFLEPLDALGLEEKPGIAATTANKNKELINKIYPMLSAFVRDYILSARTPEELTFCCNQLLITSDNGNIGMVQK